MPAMYRIFLLALTLGLLAVGASADGLCLTGNARRQQNLPVKYTVLPEAAGPLLDGSEVDGKDLPDDFTDRLSLVVGRDHDGELHLG